MSDLLLKDYYLENALRKTPIKDEYWTGKFCNCVAKKRLRYSIFWSPKDSSAYFNFWCENCDRRFLSDVSNMYYSKHTVIQKLKEYEYLYILKFDNYFRESAKEPYDYLEMIDYINLK